MVGMRRNERPSRRRQKPIREVETHEDENLSDLDDMDVDLNIDDLDDYDEDISDLDETYDTQENRGRNNKETQNKNYQNRKPKPINNRDNNKKSLLMLLIGFVAIIVIVLALVLIFGKDDKDTSSNNTTQENTIGQVPKGNSDVTGGGSTPPSTQQNTQQNTNQQNNYNQQGVTMQDGVTPGLPDTKNGNKMNNSGEMADTKGFISDVNGNKIPKDFVVQRVADETDFVNYVKRRGMTGDGIELLWLDAQYKGIPYSVQVPFKIWKELDQQGITVVDMEVLYLEDGSKVISYMKVKDNYKEILEEKK